ncbi:MAG: UvrD-helicase domain-containing protein [Acidobacteria bacterium]|nr:UvrD-helicase domain-containing protein [Acidobacteriota bacterium]
MNLLHELNEQQKHAVTLTTGPVLVLAGAGSGKTRTITYKIAHLIAQQLARPEQILAVTFTNKAAEEMRTRVVGLLQALSASPLICTFHSLAVRVLRRHAHRVGYRPDFTICDTDDQKTILRNVYEELKLADKDLPIRRSHAVISRSKNKSWGPEQYLQRSGDYDAEIIFKIFLSYQKYLEQSNAVDFDDLLLLTVKLFEEHPAMRREYSSRYQYILIDEYQDTNPPQYEIVKSLADVQQNITAVGDEDQSIYSFRGADIRNILEFERDFPGAVVVKLEQNYRSTSPILEAATALVSHNVHRKGKTLWTENPGGEPNEIYVAPTPEAEADFVCRSIHHHLQEGERNIAVMYRTNFQSRQFEEALRRFRIPYQLVGGVSFYNRKEIKDILAYLRLVINAHDNVSLLRVINEPSRGIGRITQEKLHQLSRESGVSLWASVQIAVQNNLFPAKTHLALQKFVQIIQEGMELLDLPLYSVVEKIAQASGYLEMLKRENTEEADNRILNINELIAAAREWIGTGGSVQDFLDNAALRSEADEFDASAPVTLITLHNAKGLEFPVVFLAGCEEGLVPHSRSLEEDALEEERRLFYVGMTRAQKKLYFSFSRVRRFYGAEGPGASQPSRFLMEIPERLLMQVQVPSRTYGGSVVPDGSFARGSERRLHGFVSGAMIFHDRFGHGRILQVEPLGDDLKITVQFPGLGIKKMLQSYARLKLV